MNLYLLLYQLFTMGWVHIMIQYQIFFATEQSIGREQSHGPKGFTLGLESKYEKMEQRSRHTTFLPSLLNLNLRKTLLLIW